MKRPSTERALRSGLPNRWATEQAKDSDLGHGAVRIMHAALRQWKWVEMGEDLGREDMAAGSRLDPFRGRKSRLGKAKSLSAC